ncbi:hypothetical protein [Catenulispora pinistramenti]|nr:hypothetical protein [Catenulispora pinistramenti]
MRTRGSAGDGCQPPARRPKVEALRLMISLTALVIELVKAIG